MFINRKYKFNLNEKKKKKKKQSVKSQTETDLKIKFRGKITVDASHDYLYLYIETKPKKLELNLVFLCSAMILLKTINWYQICCLACRWDLEYSDCIKYRGVKPAPEKERLGYDTKLHPLVKFPLWISGECDWLVGFYDISTFAGYLTPNPFLYE